MTPTPTVLVSGAGVAGPALAFWLHRHGFRPVVVERAASVRGGGYPVDLRGAAIDVADRMGVLPQLRAAHIATRHVSFFDAAGRRTGRLRPDDFTGSSAGEDIELPRGDLTTALYERTRDDVEYVFDDSITALDERPDGVHVTFRRGQPRTVDLVIGADGLHSNVRRLVFGPESRFRHDLGFYFSGFSGVADRGLHREVAMHNTPGRLAGWYAVGNRPVPTGFLAFAAPELRYDHADPDQQRDLVEAAFAGGGWEVPELLTAMRAADDFFFDPVSQIRMPRWSAGRVALVGDAGYAPALLSGQGSSIAMVGAYVLAGELAAAGGDHRSAFPAYERAMRGFVERNQKIARSGGFALIPSTRTGIWLRDRVVAVSPALGRASRLFAGRVSNAATSVTLGSYPALPAARAPAAAEEQRG